MPADLRKIVIFGHFTVLHISHRNEQIFTFQVSCGQLVVIFIILKAFSESRKNWSFSWPRTCEKMSILGISQFCISLNQMSKYSHFKCLVVHLVVIFIILKDFPESRKIWRFSCPRTCEKLSFLGHFTVLHISHPNEQIFTFQVSCGQLVVIFIILKAFSESRKNWSFSWPQTCEKMSILGISQFCIFLNQMSKYSYFKCLVFIWWWFSSF